MSQTPPSVSQTIDQRNTSLADVIRSRRTINFFKPEAVPRQVIMEAIDLARWAPNHHLTEPWHFYLLTEETSEAICQLNANLVRQKRGEDAAAEKLKRWRQMPGWLVVTCDRNEDQERFMEDYAAVCAAAQTLSLYLWSIGVGVKWTTGPVTRDAAFYETVWIDANSEIVVGMFWYGYPQEVPPMTRKPLEQIFVEV